MYTYDEQILTYKVMSVEKMNLNKKKRIEKKMATGLSLSIFFFSQKKSRPKRWNTINLAQKRFKNEVTATYDIINNVLLLFQHWN